MTTDKFDFEREFWGDCANTYGEETKQFHYARIMGLKRRYYMFDAEGRSIIDIGGGPVSLLLKTFNFSHARVVDPLRYPKWVYDRYEAHGVAWSIWPGELLPAAVGRYDEAWIYNVLQHVDDPELIIHNAKRTAHTVRVFEQIHLPPHAGHPHELTPRLLSKSLGIPGQTGFLEAYGCAGEYWTGVLNPP